MSFLTNYLDKSVSLLCLGKTWISTLCADIAEASRTRSYVETISNKADTLHKYISFSDQNTLKRSFEFQIREIIKRFNFKKVELAVDGKKDLFYGKKAGLKARNIKPEHGAECAWEYIVVSIVWPIRLPLMTLPYPQGADLATLTIELLEFVKTLNLQIQNILFDRGFYIAHLIDYLESKKNKGSLPYQILVPKDSAIKEYITQTKKKIGVFKHRFKYSKKKSTWKPDTTIVVCKKAGKNKKGEFYDMIFATNLKPSFKLVKRYKRRWNIETGFRIMEEGKIMTKSINPLIRLFYFLLRMLFTAIWVLSKIERTEISFKLFLRNIEKYLKRHEIYKPPPILPLF